MNDRLQALTDAGVAIWLDDLSRERITSGDLAALVESSGVVGVTTNPTIFATALSDGEAYAGQIAELKQSDTSVDDAVFEITTTDVQHACDVLRGQVPRTLPSVHTVRDDVHISSCYVRLPRPRR